jgi:molybdopterin molybdotransferase
MALMAVAEALQRVLADARALPAESVPLHQALGRVLANDLVALRTQPPAALSAMDGYAVRAADVANGPATLTLIGEVAAGHPFAGTVGPGQTARIFTGGVMPDGADTVVVQELTTREENRVTTMKPTAKARNVRAQGIDFRTGDVLLRRGRKLTDRDLMLAAAMNHPTLSVHGQPKVAVLGTGDELVAPGSTLRPGEIVYSNGFALTALASREGAAVTDLGIARDSLDDIAARIRQARDSGADILLTSGGASVGDHDLVQRALTGEGLDLSFWRVALRPGRPMMRGRLGDMHVLGVPGNPVSSYVCAFLFLAPLIRKLSGRADVEQAAEQALLGRDMPANDERADYIRATLAARPGQFPDGTFGHGRLPVDSASRRPGAGCRFPLCHP